MDLDLINGIMREPYRERLSIILNSLGTGLAGRGRDLNAVIRRADPTLRELDEVLAILAAQNRRLAALARDADTVLAPLARERRRVASAVGEIGQVATATAERRADLEATLRRLPRFLAELRPTLRRLGALADQATPVLADVGAVAPEVNTAVRELGPFSDAATTALVSLGRAGERSIPAGAGRPAAGHRPRGAGERGPAGGGDAGRPPGLVPAERRHRARDGLPLLRRRRDQRLRRVRPLPARLADRQPVLELRGGAGGGMLGELPRARGGGERAGGGRRGAGAGRGRRRPAALEPEDAALLDYLFGGDG